MRREPRGRRMPSCGKEERVADVVNRLQVILEAEESLYARLRDLLQHEREVIARLDAGALEELAREKEMLGDEARLLEESRVEVAAELAQGHGLPARSRLSEICGRLGEEGGDLRRVHHRLVILVSVVRELADANADLVGESLSEVRGTLRLLGGLLPDGALYGPEGPGSPGLEPGRLVRRSL